MIRAAVPGRAAADVAREILGRELQRRERRGQTDLPREDLIDRRAAREVLGLGALWNGAAQPAAGWKVPAQVLEPFAAVAVDDAKRKGAWEK